MSIPIVYDRYFNKGTASPNDWVDVTIVVSFISPPAPSLNAWFADCGDNLGGSNASNGPLIGVTQSVTRTNITPNVSTEQVGVSQQCDGCIRFWPNAPTWPTPPIAFADAWKPTNPNTMSSIKVVFKTVVAPTAIVGTVIGPPVAWITPSMTDFTASRVMMYHGSDFTKIIATGSVPAGCSRSLTIV